MRVKLKDVKQGKTFWAVRGTYGADGEVFSEVAKVFIKAPPVFNYSVGTYFVLCMTQTYCGNWSEDTRSLRDSNVIKNDYNMHGMFTSKKSAERYSNRILSGCLSKAEAQVRDKLIHRAATQGPYSRTLDWYAPSGYGGDTAAAHEKAQALCLPTAMFSARGIS